MSELGTSLVACALVVLGTLAMSGCAADADADASEEDGIEAESTTASITSAVPKRVSITLKYWNTTCDLTSGGYCNWGMRFTAGTYKPSPYSCVSGTSNFTNATSSGVRTTVQTKVVTDYFCPQTYSIEVFNRTTGETLPTRFSFTPSTCTTTPCTIALNGGGAVHIP